MAARIDQIATFDELNQLVGMNRSEPFDRYFGGMKLSKEQKRQRIELAERLEEEFIYCLALMFYSYPDIDEWMIGTIEERYMNALIALGVIDQDAEEMADDLVRDLRLQARKFAADTVEVTEKHKEDPYYYSEDRARVLAEGEASTVFNTVDYDAALIAGLYYKMWETAGDNHVRETHAELEGVVKHIDEPFEVGGDLMMFPRDGSLGAGAEEIANCRCSVTYLPLGAALVGWDMGQRGDDNSLPDYFNYDYFDPSDIEDLF